MSTCCEQLSCIFDVLHAVFPGSLHARATRDQLDTLKRIAQQPLSRNIVGVMTAVPGLVVYSKRFKACSKKR